MSAQMLAVNHARAQILSPFGESAGKPSAAETDTETAEREQATTDDEPAGG
jgi:hypothetical protein